MVTRSEIEGPAVGSHVKVLWGVDEVDGIVVDRYGSGPLARVRVRVAIKGSDGEDLDHEEFSLPLEALTAVA